MGNASLPGFREVAFLESSAVGRRAGQVTGITVSEELWE